MSVSFLYAQCEKSGKYPQGVTKGLYRFSVSGSDPHFITINSITPIVTFIVSVTVIVSLLTLSLPLHMSLSESDRDYKSEKNLKR